MIAPRLVRMFALLFCALAAGVLPAHAQLPSISEYADGMTRHDGFIPIVWDGSAGRLLLEISRLDKEFLYLPSLATGLGSNRMGLDRGMIGNEQIARFERVGPKIHFVLTNPAFRVETNRTEALVRSVEESFPTSTLASWTIVAENESTVLVDATPFFLEDAMAVTARLQAAGQGSFRVDTNRSRIHLRRTKAFPLNTEVEAALTFAGSGLGGEVRQHTPDARSLTIREHHSFAQLPDDDFQPRNFDPRMGSFAVGFWDYGRSFDQGYQHRYTMRHRLQKRNSGAANSEPIEPIVYYMDPAIPEPYRSAFKEGGEWWNEVFGAAGFIAAFRIEDMPADMDPMDIRYHVIQWVHRTEAGSSIGPSVVDPRTGEIIKAAVRMDSHRSLADYNLYAGALPAAGALGQPPMGRPGGSPEVFLGSGGTLDWLAELDPDVTGEEFTMSRRRQHSAHELGHTMGLAHNFVATANGRASVMDYPAPLIEVEDGQLRLANAYRPGPGAFDTLAIRWAYTEFPDGEEQAGLAAIVQEGMDRGLKFITNPDENAASSYPNATTWINGTNVLDELERVSNVRRTLIDRFDEQAIAEGAPMWQLGERFVPVYLHHRFQLGAAVKSVGGMEFRYGVRGDALPVTEIIDGPQQRQALRQLVAALSPEALAVPERILKILAPRPAGHQSIRFDFTSRAGPAFDQLGITRTLANQILGGVLNPQRMARVAAFYQRDNSLPSEVEVIQTLVDGVGPTSAVGRESTARGVLSRVVQRELVDRLIELGANEDATVEARGAAEWGLRRMATQLTEFPNVGVEEEAHRQLVVADIHRFLDRRYDGGIRTEALPAPPGTPIGNPGNGEND